MKCQDSQGADSLCSLKLPIVIWKLKFLKSDAGNTAPPLSDLFSTSFPKQESSCSCPSAQGSPVYGLSISLLWGRCKVPSAEGIGRPRQEKRPLVSFFPCCCFLWILVTFEHPVALTSKNSAAWGVSRYSVRQAVSSARQPCVL